MYKIEDFNKEQAKKINETLNNYKKRYEQYVIEHKWVCATLCKKKIQSILQNSSKEQTASWMRKNREFLTKLGLL